MKWILLYQQCTGHLAQWTAMNNSARGEAMEGKERRGEEERWSRDERREPAENMRERQDRRVGVCQDVRSRGGETQEKNKHDQTCWVNSERGAVSVCVSDNTEVPLCCPVQMPVHKHTGMTEPCQTLLPPFFLPPSTLLCFTPKAVGDSLYIVIDSWNNIQPIKVINKFAFN